MSKFALYVLTFGAILMAGCGGDGNGSSSPFRGAYAGNWQQVEGSNRGTASIEVDSGGNLTGSWDNPDDELFGDVVGKVDSAGHLTGTISYDALGLDIEFAGDVNLSGEGVLSGQIAETDGDDTYSFTLSSHSIM